MLLSAALVGLTSPAIAGWSCTMPNGAIVFRQMSECPADAVRAEQRDTPLPNPVTKFKPPPRETLTIGPALPDLPPRPAPSPTPPLPPPTKARDLVSEAYAICVMLKIKGATTCEVEVNIFSASYIDATLATTPEVAKWVCLGIANQTRQPGSPFVGRGWKLKLFSPYGDGSRPMAACNL